MKKMQSIVLALSLVLVAPMAAQAAEITLVPSVKLQIGDRDNRGYYWDGGHWRDHGWWKQHYEWRGNRWHPYGPPPSPRHNKHNDHRGDHRPGLDKHHR
ncbi:TPA: DUF2502 domain-containing protein [Escherichia coli]|nr:DUF2502 domain-containing protein [Escherichia coli]